MKLYLKFHFFFDILGYRLPLRKTSRDIFAAYLHHDRQIGGTEKVDHTYSEVGIQVNDDLLSYVRNEIFHNKRDTTSQTHFY